MCLDRIRWISALPRPGGYVEIERESVSLGGEAANTAAAMRSWGADVWLCGNDPGDGPDSEIILAALSRADLQLHPIGDRTAIRTTPVCDIYVTPDGDRTMFGKGFRGMEPVLIPALIPTASGSWFTAEPNMSAVARQATRAAAAAGMKTYLMDFVRPDEQIPPGSFWQSSTDWAGHRGETYSNIEWVKDWTAKHGCFAILTDGPNGFVAGSPNGHTRAYPAFPGPENGNSTGAGDVFRAGMLFGLGQDWPVERCLQFAAAAGCLRCRATADSPWPSLREIEALVAENMAVTRQFAA